MEKEFPLIIWPLSILFLIIGLILLATLVILTNHVGCLLMELKDERKQKSLRRYKVRAALVSLSITIIIALLCVFNQTLKDFFLTKEFIIGKILFLPIVGLFGFGLAFINFRKKKRAPLTKKVSS